MKLKPEITKERVEKEVSQFFCMKSGCEFYTGSGKQRRLRKGRSYDFQKSLKSRGTPTASWQRLCAIERV